MNQNSQQWNQRWVDDHLDMYNYAVQIGDIEWQQQLLIDMRNKEQLLREEALNVAKEELWEQFNTVNHKMMELIARRKVCASSDEDITIKELIEDLKQQRIELAKQIKKICS
ncbi:hypothetical protein A8990_102177 [Paenibacillus taihuensis]|uniref:Uncharacterized protein n=1 Tax=Paenibacillus taihuensis TaxID=1156355 RepID=A0A3D9SQY4_9BACL|nr:hypothetical protein [Paenibacillus taihuensis]REE93091.1 hypothetical protein A8990_102177 [Paenibacillus taihuensis]